MAHPEWRIHGPDTLAAYLPDSDFRGLLERRLAVPPDHLAILIRDGAIAGTYRGAMFATGGVWQRLKDAIGGGHALRLLVADLKPFQTSATLEGFTRDREEIAAEVVVDFQLDPDKPLEVMGLVSDNRALMKDEVFARVRPHIQERVVIAELVQHDAAELRANAGLQDRFQAQIMREVERVAGDMGLLVRAVSVNWALTDSERQAIKEQELKRREDFAALQHARMMREYERANEATVFKLRANLDRKKVEAATEHDFQVLLQEQALQVEDARTAAGRLGEMKALQHKIELEKTQRLSVYDERIGEATNDLDRARIQLERKRLELEYGTFEKRQELDLLRLAKEQEIELAAKSESSRISQLDALADVQAKQTRLAHELSKDEFLTKHAAETERERIRSEAELAKLRQQAAMTPEQLLATQAGLSPEVAKVFAEKVRGEAGASADREALLREMVAMAREGKMSSEEQARLYFQDASKRLADVGVAAATGRPGGASAAAGPHAPAHGEGAECPACHRRIPADDRWCRYCGHQMRT